jgi:ribosomal protein S18 acetylase RimI-like enzyme
MRQFDASAEIDERMFWESDEMKARYRERWHVQSVVVSSKYQRRGLGRMLMSEVLRRAQEDGVVVGLEASGDGENLYRSLGFELRGRFSMNLGEVVGGVMMWSPKNVRSR